MQQISGSTRSRVAGTPGKAWFSTFESSTPGTASRAGVGTPTDRRWRRLLRTRVPMGFEVAVWMTCQGVSLAPLMQTDRDPGALAVMLRKSASLMATLTDMVCP
jgi:hypothetical protein